MLNEDCIGRIIMFVILLHVNLWKSSDSTCSCGYGSYCGAIDGRKCLCGEISRGLYKTPLSDTKECSTLENHCLLLYHPCSHDGKCLPSFGSFYCNCNPKFHGHNCELYTDSTEESYAQNVMVYYDMHEYDLDQGVTFLVIIKEFGGDFSIEVDDGLGQVYQTPFLEFQPLNPKEICQNIAAQAPEADPKICKLLPDELTNVARIVLKYPFEYRDAYLLADNGITVGRKDYVHVVVKNYKKIEFSQAYPIFTPFNKNRLCTLAIQLQGCSNNSKAPATYGRHDDFIIRSTTQSIVARCKFVTSIKYYWQVTGNIVGHSYDSISRGESYKVFESRTLLPGLYTVELKVEVFGSYSAGEPKTYYRNVKKCWFEMKWEDLVPVLNFGKRRVVKENTKVLLDASPSYDPNFDDNRRLSFTWYCNTSDSFCKPITQKEPTREISGMTVGTYEMFLELSHSSGVVRLSQTSQIIEVISKPVIEGFEVMCLKNCLNTRVHELTHLQLKVLPSNAVVWTYQVGDDPEKNVDDLKQDDTPDDIFIIKKDVLDRGSVYTIKAKVDDTYSAIQLITVDFPKKTENAECKINPGNGTSGYTLFDISCSGYEPPAHGGGKPLRYDIYQKIGDENNETENYESFLISSSQIPIAIDLQLISEEVKVEICSAFGDCLMENLTVELTYPAIDRAEIDNLVYKSQDNFRNGEIEKGMTSVYTIGNRLEDFSEKIAVIDALIENINKVPMQCTIDARQVAGGLHFLLNKSIKLDKKIISSKSTKIAALTLNNIVVILNEMIKKIDYVDTEELIEVSRSILGTVNALIQSREENFNSKTENMGVYLQSYYNYNDASSSIINTINNLSGLLLNQMLPSQKPIKIEEEFIVTLLLVDRMNRLVDMDEIDPAVGGAGYIKFDRKLALSFTGREVEVQITDFKRNLFWWLETAFSMNSEHLNVKMHIRNYPETTETIMLEHPLHLFLKVNFTSDNYMTGEAEQPIDALTLYEKDLYVKVFKIDRKEGTGSKLFVEFHNLGINELDVIITVDEYPDYDTVRKKGKTVTMESNRNNYESESLANELDDSIIYLGILPGVKHPGGTKISFKYEIHDHLCRVWSGEFWDIGTCGVASDSNITVVHCQCKHLSVFGASVLVPPNQIHPIKDIALIITVKDNPYVFSMVIFFLFIYFALFIWAWRMDQKDKYERDVRLLVDNFPGETYGYLLAVFTGEKPLSGTTAKVGVKIHGSNGEESHAHILNHDKHTLQLAQDNWFLIFTENYLGEIDCLHVWHDNSGSSPDWNCSKIVLYDLSTNEKYIFLVDKWLSVNSVKNDWKLEWKLKPTKLDDVEWQNLVRENFFMGLREAHLWISIFVRHPRTSYTRLQRLTVAMSLLMVTMLLALMFYGAAEKIAEDDPTLSLSRRELVVSLECLVISIPISMVIVSFFKISMRPSAKKIYQDGNEKISRNRSAREKLTHMLKVFLTMDPLLPVELSVDEAPAADKDTTKRKILLIIAWVVNFTIIFGCSFFLILYGLKLGPNKSINWMSVTLLRLGHSTFLVQPVKIIVCALLITFIFKEYHRNEMLFSIEYTGIDRKLKEDAQYMSKLMELRSKPMYNPLSELDIMMLYKNRKKTEQQSWSLINLIFVSIIYFSLCILIGGTNSSTAHYHTEHLIDLLKTPTSATDLDIDEVYNKRRFFEYTINTLLPSLHTSKWYNGQDLPMEKEEEGKRYDEQKGWTNDYSNKLLGVPRLRQLRIVNETCLVPKWFQPYFKTCNSSFSTSIEDVATYTLGWFQPTKFDNYEKMWNHSSPAISESLGMYGASGYFYPGGGYIRNLTTNLKDSSKEVVKLKLENWFDQLTRVVFIEFNLYNAFSNLFSQVTLIFEKLPSGIIGTRVYIDTAYQNSYIDTLDIPFLIALIFFIVILILSVMRIVIHVSVEGIGPFLNAHENNIDLLIIFFGVSSVVAYLVRIGHFKVYSDAYEKTDNESFVSFSYPFYQVDLLSIVLCILVVITTIRLLLLAHYGKYFYILRNTIKESCGYIICTFILVLFFTSLLSIVAYLNETQQSHMFNILLVPRFNFIESRKSYEIASNEMSFKVGLNMVYLFGGMLITSVFIFYYAKSKFYLITIGRVEGYTNHFFQIYNSFQQGLKSLLQENVELHIQSGTATRREKLEYRRKLYDASKKKVIDDFKLKKWEAEDIMKDFMAVSRRHKTMCEQLDKIFELIE